MITTPEIYSRENKPGHIQLINHHDLDYFSTFTPNYLANICEITDKINLESNLDFPGEVNCNFFKQKNGEVSLYLSIPESGGDTNYLYLINIPFSNKVAILLDTKNPEVALFSACTVDEDILSAQIVRSGGDLNLAATPTFSQSQAETTACFQSINNPTDLTLKDEQGKIAHTIFVPPRDGNQGVFELGSDPMTIVLDGRQVPIETLLMSLKIQLAASDNKSVNDIDLRIITSTLSEDSFSQSLEFLAPKPIIVETAIAEVKEKPPIHIATNAEIAATTFRKSQEENLVLGNTLSLILDCQSEKCPDIYHVNDLSSPRAQLLLSSIIEKNYFNQTIQNQINDIIHPSLWDRIRNKWNELFHKPPILTNISQIDEENFHLQCSIVPYLTESSSGKTIICFTQAGELYIIQGHKDEFNDLQLFLQSNYQIDVQGTNFIHAKEENLDKIPPASFATTDKTEIFVFPPGFRNEYSYDELSFLSKELEANTTGYLLDSNGNLLATEIPFGISGNYTGITFFDESTNMTYLGITVTDISKTDNQQNTYYIKYSDAILPIADK